jgi:hypothetical protein
LKHKKYPFALSLSKCRRNWRQGFDRLSPNGVGSVFAAPEFPIILSLSKGGLSLNGVGVVFEVVVLPIILSLSKDRLSPNGMGVVFGAAEFPIILSLSKGRLSPNGVGVVPIWAGTLEALIV